MLCQPRPSAARNYRLSGPERYLHWAYSTDFARYMYSLSCIEIMRRMPRASLALTRLPGVRADQRDEAHPAESLGVNHIVAPGEPQKQLLVAPAHRDQQPTAVGQLLAQRLRRPRRRRRNGDRVERRIGWQPGRPITHNHMHILKTQVV